MILRPQRNFTVVRQLANHTDSSIYYVRAVIRDAYTDVILDTLDLTSRGDQRFSKNWRVSPDPSGMGRDISIVTSVYTDSGYTTKSENYGDEENTHLIEENSPLGKGGGGSGVDSRTLRRIVEEVIDAKLSQKEKPEEKEGETSTPVVEKKSNELVVLESIETQLKSLQETIGKLPQDKPEKIDYKPFSEGIKSILSAVNEKEVTEPTDFGPLLARLDEKDTDDGLSREESLGILNELRNLIEQKLPAQIAQMLKTTSFGITLMPTTVQAPEGVKEEKKEEVEKPIPFDIKSLAE